MSVNLLDNICDLYKDFEVPIYQGQMPDDPDELILINWSRGYTGLKGFDQGFSTLKYPVVAVRSRAKEYDEAYKNIIKFDMLFRGEYAKELPVLEVELEGNVGYYERDEHQRYEFLSTYVLTINEG